MPQTEMPPVKKPHSESLNARNGASEKDVIQHAMSYECRVAEMTQTKKSGPKMSLYKNSAEPEFRQFQIMLFMDG